MNWVSKVLNKVKESESQEKFRLIVGYNSRNLDSSSHKEVYMYKELACS